MTLAPVLLFVYNRPSHTRETVEALLNNELAAKSQLIIYSDGARDSKSAEKVREVRTYIQTISAFKNIRIIERDSNWGLARSIIDGVSEVVKEFGRVIVLEDDIVTSPYFLKFMNDALEFYNDTKKVMHISGWNYPVHLDEKTDVFLWRTMNCWGWATWADRWCFFNKDCNFFFIKFSPDEIRRFNLDGANNFWKQLISNRKGKIETWGIFWYASIFARGGLCLNPTRSFVQNIGIDGSGTHSGKNINMLIAKELNHKTDISFPTNISEDSMVLSTIKQFYRSINEKISHRLFIKFKKLFQGL